jgi:putative transferase (TIGR04331 family)
MERPIFLATTALKEFWDLESKLLLLGIWCLSKEENKKFLEGKDYIVIPSPWKPSVKIKEAADYCFQVYEGLLEQLTENLNSLHDVAYPARYWKVLLGPWLINFIEVFYDRFKRIETAIKMFPDFYTCALFSRDCDLSTFDTREFLVNSANEDFYNLKLLSFLLYKICPNNVKFIENNINSVSAQAKNITIKRLNNNYKGIIYKILNCCSKKTIVLSDMYHLNFIDMFSLQLMTGLRNLCFLDLQLLSSNGNKLTSSCSCELRKKFLFKKHSDKFESLLAEAIPMAIPMCYIENFSFFKKQVSTIKGINSVKVVGSSIGWYVNEEFKFFAAELVLSGAGLIDFQHGGGYGFSLAMPTETLSLEKNMFYTWGWDSKDTNKIKPLPSPHLSKSKDTNTQEFDNVLLVGMDIPRFHYRFHTISLPEDMPKYFEDRKRFLSFLRDEIKERLLYRPYHHEYWEEADQLVMQECPNARVIKTERLVDLFKRVKLVIIDYPHTTFLEALVVNVPCVFFWDYDIYLMRKEAEEYFTLLRKADVLFQDPESAAEKVNEIYDKPLEWWSSFEVQTARNDFCRRYAYASKDWLKIWAKELKQLL